MKSLQEEYQTLLSLTQIHILREYSLKDYKSTHPTSYRFFQTSFSKNSSIYKNNINSKPIEFISTSSFLLTSTPSPMQPSPDPQTPAHSPSPSIPQPDPVPTPEPSRPDPLPPTTPPETLSPDPLPPNIINHSKNFLKNFTLEPLLECKPKIDKSMIDSMKSFFPHIQWISSLPDDRLARKKREAWINYQIVPPIIILSFQKQAQYLPFLKNVAESISCRLAPARVMIAEDIEKKGQWNEILTSPSLRLVIASDYGIYLQNGLKSYYREIPQEGKHFLQNIPLLLLSDLSLYLKQPQLKSLLWRAICNEFTSLSFSSSSVS